MCMHVRWMVRASHKGNERKSAGKCIMHAVVAVVFFSKFYLCARLLSLHALSSFINQDGCVGPVFIVYFTRARRSCEVTSKV